MSLHMIAQEITVDYHIYCAPRRSPDANNNNNIGREKTAQAGYAPVIESRLSRWSSKMRRFRLSLCERQNQLMMRQHQFVQGSIAFIALPVGTGTNLYPIIRNQKKT